MNPRAAKIARSMAAVAVISLTPGSVIAQNVIDACADDIKAQCSSVEPGHGHVLACLYAHEEKLSDDCDAAVADVHDKLDLFFELFRFTKQECRDDIETYCKDAVMGNGRIYSCLTENAASLSEDCASAVSSISIE